MRYLILLFVALTCSNSVIADDLIKTGESLEDFEDFISRSTTTMRAISHGINFKESTFELRKGEKIEDGCRQSNERLLSGKGGRYISVEIARDHSTCESLYEVGIVDESTGDLTIELYTSSEAVPPKETIGNDFEQPQASSTIEGCADISVTYTDGNHPLMQTVRSLITSYDGILAGSASAGFGYRGYPPLDDMCTSRTPLTVQGYSPSINAGSFWTKDAEESECPHSNGMCIIDCGLNRDRVVRQSVSGQVSSDSSLPGVFDCSDGAKIVFELVGIETIKARPTDTWHIFNTVTVSGPVENCTENLYRVDEFDSQSCNIPD